MRMTNSEKLLMGIAIAMLFAVMFLVLTLPVHAQTWHTTNQATVSWNAVTTLADEAHTPIPAEDVITYKVYLANALTDSGKTNPLEIAETADTSYILTLDVEGQYFVGVQTIRKHTIPGIGADAEDEVVTIGSDIAWSDMIEHTPDPFGLRYFLLPDAPTGLVPSGG